MPQKIKRPFAKLPPDAAGTPPAGDRELPLDYMLRVMNDSTVDAARRDRMAVAAAPFCHLKKGEGGKKDAQAEAAEKVALGRFAPPPAPGQKLN